MDTNKIRYNVFNAAYYIFNKIGRGYLTGNSSEAPADIQEDVKLAYKNRYLAFIDGEIRTREDFIFESRTVSIIGAALGLCSIIISSLTGILFAILASGVDALFPDHNRILFVLPFGLFYLFILLPVATLGWWWFAKFHKEMDKVSKENQKQDFYSMKLTVTDVIGPLILGPLGILFLILLVSL